MITVKDLRSVSRGLERLQEKLDTRSREAVGKVVAKTYLQSQDLVPVDTGNLRQSGVVSGVVKIDDTYTASIIYKTEYAAFVHEDLDAKHPHGQAKYLETPMNQAGELLKDELSKSIK